MATDSPASTLSLPLGNRPRVVNCGLALHGFRGAESYQLPRLWCLHLYFYEVMLEVGGHMLQVVPGSLTLIPPQTRIVYHFADKHYRHFYVHFDLGAGNAPILDIPVLQHLPDAKDDLLARLQHMQRVRTHHDLHAETLFWGILWDVAETGQRRSQDVKRGPALLKTIEAFVEERLPGDISVHDIARHVELSTTHVNRVIRSQLKITTTQLVTQRRLQRAYRLLLHSTMPIKRIAAECGMADLQQFNKRMRACYGKSPRHLQARGEELDLDE
ncbi:MAG: helix-turn-helix transcriptional regulator [Candidatus Methylacidiphilales bacterium]|nr:AraC family transcriptional regulator [Candidatus Methylacidiphilales bacterium]